MSAAAMAHAPLMQHAPAELRLEQPLLLRCTVCHASLDPISRTGRLVGSPSMLCTNCGFRLECDNGIWLALRPDRKSHFARFTRDYESIRKSEGRGSQADAFYLGLPFHDLTGNNSPQWKIRARSYHVLERAILRPAAERRARPLAILDLGAGNGWLSYRLTNLGHHPVAVDLVTNDFDGLGAARHYLGALPKLFPRFQAEMDGLPFENAQFDCAIFNASFHYSENYRTTLAEALRCVRPGGGVAIVDSPWYRAPDSGKQMVEERHRAFESRYGFRSDALANREYLTDSDLADLESHFKVHVRIDRPWYGVRWALRPLIAKLKNKREPSKFRLYSVEVPSA